MFLITIDESNLIANISKKAELTNQGYYSYDEDAFYPVDGYELIEVESVPEEVSTYLYTYTKEEGFKKYIVSTNSSSEENKSEEEEKPKITTKKRSSKKKTAQTEE